MRKIQICVSVDEELYKELKQQASESGLPLSNVVVLRLKGYQIIKDGGK